MCKFSNLLKAIQIPGLLAYQRTTTVHLQPDMAVTMATASPSPVRKLGFAGNTAGNGHKGFIQRGGGPGIPTPPPLPEILKLSMVITVCCLESLSQIASEAIWEDLNSKFSRGGGDMPTDPPSSHTRFACYYHPATILFPPQLKIQFPPYSAQSFLNTKEPQLSSTVV